MPISGLVIVCSGGAADVLRDLQGEATLTIGPCEIPGRIPVVLETEGDRSHRRRLRWLRELDGVSHVELAFADYRHGEGGAETKGTATHVD